MGKELDISSICSGQDPKSLYNGYIEYTQNQRNAFLLIVKYMKMCLDTLSKRGIIGNNINLTARIKSPKSALNNDIINVQYSKTGKKKELDDVFGTEILAADEAELKAIREYLERFLTPLTIAKYNKPNGYIATHTVSRLKHDEDTASKKKFDYIPDIEIQYKTFEVSMNATTGKAAHTKYKNENVEEIQRELEIGTYDIHNVPEMWICGIRNGIKDKGLRQLTLIETLKHMYPTLNLDRIHQKYLEKKPYNFVKPESKSKGEEK